jgi:hypothetical protein
MNENFYIDLKKAIKEAGSLTKFAKNHGFSNTFISLVNRRIVKPGDRLLAALGYKKHTIIEKD